MPQPNVTAALTKEWRTAPRWAGITRPYTAEDVVRLRGTVQIETLSAIPIEGFIRSIGRKSAR